MKFATATTLAAALAASSASAQVLSPLASFGGGDGWRAPNEVLVGDSTGATYNFLGIANNERGLAYNPVTGNLVLVSRTGGNNMRLLNGLTGVDVGSLSNTGITGGTFAVSAAGVTGDGTIFVANLSTNVAAGGTPFKVYSWASEAQAAPATYFNATVSGFVSGGTPRLGDSFDVTGTSANPVLTAGAGGNGATGTLGYAIIAGGTPTATAYSTFTPGNPNNGDFRLGTTFAGTANDVWGKQTSALLRQSTYAGASATLNGSVALTSAGENLLDYATISGVPYLATLDVNSSLLRVYNVTNPAAPVLAAFLTTTTGALTANANGVGQVAFGAITGNSATIYAMSTNQGIQAFTFTAVPEPSSLALVGVAGLAALRRFRKRA